MFFVLSGQELMQLLCIFFTLFSQSAFLHLFPLPSLPPSPLSLLLGRTGFESVLLSVREDIRHSCVWVCLPSPLSLIPPLPTALSFHKEEGDFLLLSPFPLLFLYCKVTAAKNLCSEVFQSADKITGLHNHIIPHEPRG